VRGLSLFCLVLAVSACGGSSAPDFESIITACRSLASASCTRESQCQPGQVNVDTCSQLLAQNCNAAVCPAGYVYSPTTAQTCYNDYLNQDCPDSNSSVVPASCQAPLPCIPP
jgi:hypothetical protein